MSNLTSKQEAALATFKENLHLPNGGFHTLITELGKEYQLPFQKVRSVVKQTQQDTHSGELDRCDQRRARRAGQRDGIRHGQAQGEHKIFKRHYRD